MKNTKIITGLFLSIMLIFLTITNLSGESSGENELYAVNSDYIKWLDFDVCCEAMSYALQIDVESHSSDKPLTFCESLSYLGAKYGGNFKKYKKTDLTSLYEKVKSGADKNEIFSELKYFPYYSEAYSAVLSGMVGEYYKGDELKYGIKVFSPIARGYYYNDYDDFGASRSFGYRRPHLGHDMLGSVGTPIIAVESGYVESVGWNMYGGWRIGIRSFDKKRYYYYAHLRKDHPYNDIYEGKIITAGEVIGYLGMTGYSRKENVNGIETPHLHIGLQIIFDESQKDGNGEIWIDFNEISKFLLKNKSSVYKDAAANEYYAADPIIDYKIPD